MLLHYFLVIDTISVVFILKKERYKIFGFFLKKEKEKNNILLS
jgi:hypothetical protein